MLKVFKDHDDDGPEKADSTDNLPLEQHANPATTLA